MTVCRTTRFHNIYDEAYWDIPDDEEYWWYYEFWENWKGEPDPLWVKAFPPLYPENLGYNHANEWRPCTFPMVTDFTMGGKYPEKDWWLNNIEMIFRTIEYDLHLGAGILCGKSSADRGWWKVKEWTTGEENAWMPVEFERVFWEYEIFSFYGPTEKQIQLTGNRFSPWRMSIISTCRSHWYLNEDGDYEGDLLLADFGDPFGLLERSGDIDGIVHWLSIDNPKWNFDSACSLYGWRRK